MKQKLLMIALLSSVPCVYAMNDDAAAPAAQTAASEDEITPDEKACFEWFEPLQNQTLPI